MTEKIQEEREYKDRVCRGERGREGEEVELETGIHGSLVKD